MEMAIGMVMVMERAIGIVMEMEIGIEMEIPDRDGDGEIWR